VNAIISIKEVRYKLFLDSAIGHPPALLFLLFKALLSTHTIENAIWKDQNITGVRSGAGV
jgi:hypothetical protein